MQQQQASINSDNAPASDALVLSPEEVNRLLNDTSSDTRVDMTQKIASVYNLKNLNGRDSVIAEQIFRLLMRDTELRVRVSLAEHIKDSTQIPRDIVMTLARDVEEVSLPMLQHSEVLNDNDIMDLLNATEQVSRYLAISKRKRVPVEIADKLIERGNNAVAGALVNNEGAEISEQGYDRIVDVHRHNETLMNALSKRPQLPVAVVDKMVTVVSSTLAAQLKQKYKTATMTSAAATATNTTIDREVEKARDKETLGLVRMAASDEDIDKLVNQLHGYGRLTAPIILSALCQGDFRFFESGLAKLSGVPVSNARKLISDRGDLGFRAIYNKSGLPEKMFPAVKVLLRVVRELVTEGEQPATGRFANHVVERLLKHSEKNPVENLSYIIAMVRRGGQ